MFNLTNKVVLVTGGGRGLGRGIALALAEAGAALIVADVAVETAEETAVALRSAGHRAQAVGANVLSEDSVHNAIQAGLDAFGRIDVLINNAGVIAMHAFLDLPLADYDRTFDVNVRGIVLTSQLVARQMILQGDGGAIVNIASNAGKVGYGSMADYNASKAAVISLTRTMALELAAHQINVNAVCPGAVETPMLLAVARTIVGENGDAHTLMQTFAPPQLGRLIQPVEVGRIVAFLASDAATIIRGQSINVDAGLTPY